MKTPLLLTALAITALSSPLAAQTNSTPPTQAAAGGDRPGTDAKRADAQKPMDDASFAKKAALKGMAEVELGQLAEKKAQNASLKSFAAKMVKDHGAANAELKKIAADKSIELPAELDAKHQETLNRLKALEGSAFDKAYAEKMVEAHEKTITLFEDASTQVSDEDLKDFARAKLPALKQHLAQIEAIQKTLSDEA